MPTLTFRFNAKPTGPFDYTPTADWNYGHGDELIFESDSGPFAILFDPIEGEHFADIEGPLAGDENLLVSDDGPKTFRATGQILSSLTAEERRTLFAANGKIGSYTFKIAASANSGQETFRDDTKNGGYIC